MLKTKKENLERKNWKYINLPKDIIKEIDEIIAANRYPEGRWHSRAEYLINAVREKMDRDKNI